MVQENEIIMCVLGLGALAFLLAGQFHLRRIPAAHILIVAFCGLALGWVLTVLEGFFPEGLFWNTTLNALEHACYAFSGISLAVWTLRVFRPVREAQS